MMMTRAKAKEGASLFELTERPAEAHVRAAKAVEARKPRRVRGGHQSEPGGERPAPPRTVTGVALRGGPAPLAKIDDPFLAMVREVALNKDIDVTKLDALIAAQERVMDRNARMAFDVAMARMQPTLPVITKDGRIVVREKDSRGQRTGEKTQDTPYAKWEKINPIIKPILAKHGFSLTFRPSTAPDGRLRITAVLKGHGHTDDSCYMDLAADATGSKNNAQAWASSLSYGKRHVACAALNIATKDEDDDAKAGGGPVLTVGEPLTEEQLAQIMDLVEATECPKAHLLGHLNKVKPKGHPEAGELAHLPAARFDEIVAALRGYEANKKAREVEAKK
jgi:hypothetical protein